MDQQLRFSPGLLGSLLLTMGLLVATSACGARPAPTPVPPTATIIATYGPPTATPLPLITLVDAELLDAPNMVNACDAPEGATLTCDTTQTPLQLDVESSAATYARWRLQWPNSDHPLTGDETLTLDLTVAGDLSPNLYLVETDGPRVGMSLARFGLPEGQQTLHVPLREVRDGEGNRPNFENVNEIQLVFEWADMAGTLQINSVRFDSVWQEAVSVGDEATALAATLTVPDGFVVTALADNLRETTQIEFTPAGDMLVSLQNGRIWWYSDTDANGFYATRHLYATGFTEVVGLLYDPSDGSVWIGGRGDLFRTHDSDGNGVADVRELRVSGLPWGRHQNNGLEWNPDPDPFSGEPGGDWIYFGLGAVDDLAVGGDLNATVLRFPRTGTDNADLEVVSRGNRNAYDVTFAKLPIAPDAPEGETAWQLFASENGPDFNDAPDEVNHIRWGHDYGFPDHFGMVQVPVDEGEPYSSPVYPVVAHGSANGLAFIEHPDWPDAYRTLYVSLFGEVFSPTPVGHTVERITLTPVTTPNGETTYRGEPSDFIVGMDRPLPLAVAPDGNLIAGDYATGVVYLIHYDD